MTEEQKEFELTPFQGINESEVYLGERALQKVKTAYTTAVAVQRPRSIERIANNVLYESKLAGSAFYYRWEVKNNKTGRKSIVQGASIDLAMCIARNYGNCVVDVEASETSTHYMIKGIFIDLETGFTVPRLYRQRKNQNIGSKYGDDRAEDIVFQIAQSKAQRNAILKAMPAWLIDRCIEVAREAEVSQIKPENIALARAKVLEFFGKYGISLERIEDKMEREIDSWTAEDIVDLRAAATALKEGRITPEDLFPSDKQEERETEDLESRILDKTKSNGIHGEKISDTDRDMGKAQDEGKKEEKPWWHIDNWNNLRSSGFTAFCIDNQERLTEIPTPSPCEYRGKEYKYTYAALMDKWDNIYHGEKPFPEPVKIEEGGDTKSEDNNFKDPPEENAGDKEKSKAVEINLRSKEMRPDIWEKVRAHNGFANDPRTLSLQALEIWNQDISRLVRFESSK